MKANVGSIKKRVDDQGVSPVIAVILMVAITVVLAATVYVWVSGFASEDSGPEQASATARGFAVDGSDTNWIRVTLVKGENAPYDENQVGFTLLTPSGDSYGPNATNAYLCTSAKAATGASYCATGEEFYSQTAPLNEWDVGGVLYVPCQGAGDHSLTVTVRGTTVLDSSVKCDKQVVGA